MVPHSGERPYICNLFSYFALDNYQHNNFYYHVYHLDLFYFSKFFQRSSKKKNNFWRSFVVSLQKKAIQMCTVLHFCYSSLVYLTSFFFLRICFCSHRTQQRRFVCFAICYHNTLEYTMEKNNINIICVTGGLHVCFPLVDST